MPKYVIRIRVYISPLGTPEIVGPQRGLGKEENPLALKTEPSSF